MLELGEVVAIENEGVKPQPGENYRYLGLEHIEQQTGRILNTQETDGREIQSLKYAFGPWHVLYGKLRPNLNKVALPAFSGICSTDILPLASRGQVLREFVAYYLRTPEFVHYAVQHASGTKMPRFGPRQLLKVSLPVPPLPVQERVVQVLQKADEVRRKRRETLEIADSALQAAFISMFGDPSRNPNCHALASLGELAEVRSGVTKGRRLREGDTVQAPYLRVANVQDGFLDLADVRTIEVLRDEVEKYHLEDGDILMTEGGDPDKLGRGSIWRGQTEGCIHQNHVFRVRTDRRSLTPEYLAALLRTKYAKTYFLSCAKRTSNLASINKKQVSAFMVPVPPMPLQRKFVVAVEQWRQTEERLIAARRGAEKLFSSLLQQAFTGTLTASWEAAGAAEIADLQASYDRLPRLLLLALLVERARRTTHAAAEVLVTALMKYAFLLQMEGDGGRRRFYHFVPYHYGPFAEELVSDLQALRKEGLVRVENDSDVDKTEITLLDLSKAGESLVALPDDLKEDAATIIESYGGLDDNALLRTVYERYPAYAKRSRLRKGRRTGRPQKPHSRTK